MEQQTETDLSIGLINQNVNQLDRMDILSNFMLGNIHILIATDLIGVHGSDVCVTIFLDLPIQPTEKAINMETFARRAGRCARGSVFSLVQSDMVYNISAQFHRKNAMDHSI